MGVRLHSLTLLGVAVLVPCVLVSCGQSDDHPPVICSGLCPSAGGTSGGPQGAGATIGSSGGSGGIGSGGADVAGSGGEAGGSGGLPEGGAAGQPSGDPLRACWDYCSVAVSCGRESSAMCTQHCERLPTEWDAACLELKLAEYACIATLDCAAIDLYDEEGRMHADCGVTYLEFAETCLLDGGTPPDQCVQYCEAGAACVIDFPSVIGCSDACAEDLTKTDRGGGTPCMTAKRDVYGCIGLQPCEDVQAFIMTGAFPAACSAYVQAFAAACP
jgi:hypothetical protein